MTISEMTSPKCSPYFQDNADGTVTDCQTGLRWQRFAIGQEWDGSCCVGEAKMLTRDEADGIKMEYAGTGDWRLPSQSEIESLVFKSQPCFFDTMTFKENGSEKYWTSTPSVSSNVSSGVKGRVVVNFKDGACRPTLSPTAQARVRLVSGEINTVAPINPAIQ